MADQVGEARRYPGFDGLAGRTVPESRPSWLEDPAPPEGAPNVIIMLTDDLGFSDIGCFGSEIRTPNLDRLAERGVRYSNFHVMPLCSPTRAALLTGVNSHAAGVASVTNGGDAGFPGNRGELAENVVSAAEVFRANGYATMMVGKWHLTGPTHLADGAAKASWPLQRGFDRFYGFLEEGFTDYHNPNMLIEDNHVVAVDEYPEGYYLTDDLTTKSIEMVRAAKSADDRQPVFLYFAHGAVHAPIHSKPENMARYEGRYHIGWDALRAERFAKQKALGVVAADTRLPARNTEDAMDVVAWDELSDDEQRVFARHMEAYAGMVDSIDENVGRLLELFDDLGELDNTIFIFTSDNGASKEGGARGTTEYLRVLANNPMDPVDSFERDLPRIDLIGGPQAQTHYPRGWAMAGNTPFRMYKCTTWAGGHQVPFILSWPARIGDAGSIRRQYTHVTDVLPTLIDLLGLHRPDQRLGIPVRGVNGVSFAGTLADPSAESAHLEQYYEFAGHRAYYDRGWEIVTLHQPGAPWTDEEWQLFRTEVDPTQIDNLAADEPGKLKELIAGWDQMAWDNMVYPLGPGIPAPPKLDELFERPVRLTPAHHTLERFRSAMIVAERSFAVDVDVAYQAGDEGVLFAHGDQAGGYMLYVEGGKLVFLHNGFGALAQLDAGAVAEGDRAIRVQVDAPGAGLWNVRVLVDGVERASEDGLEMIWGPLSPFEGIDVGIDRRSPVSWDVRQRRGPFRYAGDLRSVTFTPGELAPDAARRRTLALRESLLKFD